MKRRILFTICLFAGLFSYGQKNLPQDYLPAEFHAGRREALRELMAPNSVTIVMAYPTRNFSNDVDYIYHPNPDLYYFSGYKEPHSLMLIFKEAQKGANGEFRDLIFVQKRNPQAEQWTGIRMGVEGVKDQLRLNAVYNGEDFKNIPIDLSKFDSIYLDALPIDVSDSRNDPADLFDLIKQLKEKLGIKESLADNKKLNPRGYRHITGELRQIKTDEEMALLRKAVEISCIGQLEVMKAVHANMSETEIQGLHEFVHKKYGAEYVGYPSIVGAGNNGCVLHYIENNKTKVGNELILMDVGAEYHGYTADVTRTIPANGKFSTEQKLIYNLVYDAQEAAFKLCKNGTSWQELNAAATNVLAEGLLKLGIIQKKEEIRKYYPHSLGHHLGMDVHDRNNTREIRKGMVITIEPGIYIPEGSPCDKKWWGIAVRIEDDILIRENDFEMLSGAAPRKAEEVEKAIALKSPLDNFKLPPLKSDKKAF